MSVWGKAQPIPPAGTLVGRTIPSDSLAATGAPGGLNKRPFAAHFAAMAASPRC